MLIAKANQTDDQRTAVGCFEQTAIIHLDASHIDIKLPPKTYPSMDQNPGWQKRSTLQNTLTTDISK